jgi:hypothetical protein
VLTVGHDVGSMNNMLLGQHHLPVMAKRGSQQNYLRFELILHTLYNIAIAVAQNDFLKADLNTHWNPYCVNS